MPRNETDDVRANSDRLSALVEARYGAGHGPSGLAGNAVVETLLDHRSIRHYTGEAVPDVVVQAMVAAGQSAATSSNLQLWSLVSVVDPARKARLSKLAGDQRHIEEAPLLLVWLADLSRTRRIAEMEGFASAGADYLEAFLTAAIDASLAAQNAAVAAQSLGYGICYIGGMRNHPVEVAAELGLPPEVFAVFGMTVGRPSADDVSEVKPRLSQASIHFSERYAVEGFEEEAAAYNATLRAFQESQKMSVHGWTSTVARRLSGPEKLSNRDKLKAYLRQLGFRLD